MTDAVEVPAFAAVEVVGLDTGPVILIVSEATLARLREANERAGKRGMEGAILARIAQEVRGEVEVDRRTDLGDTLAILSPVCAGYVAELKREDGVISTAVVYRAQEAGAVKGPRYVGRVFRVSLEAEARA